MKISVILPVYNAADYIWQTLNMVRMQTLPQSDIEIIIFLDAPTDNSRGMVTEYKKMHPEMNIILIDSETNSGPAAARNTAIQYASGEYIHFLDADDIINTDFYNALYTAATQYNADVAVASYIHERWPENSIVFDNEFVLQYASDKINTTRADINGYSWRYLIRRSFWNYNQLSFPSQLRYCEDLPTMVRAIYFSNHIVTVPDAVYVYKHRPNSLLTNKKTKQQQSDGYRHAITDVYLFMTQYNIKRSTAQKQHLWIKLFNIVPVARLKWSENKTRCHFYLFGIIPVFSTYTANRTKHWTL